MMSLFLQRNIAVRPGVPAPPDKTTDTSFILGPTLDLMFLEDGDFIDLK
jgi:hypothetical protein